MKKLLLIPFLLVMSPTSALADGYIVTFNAEKACNELMQYGGTDEFTLQERNLMCLQMLSYFDTKYPQ